jgi:collagenase-like PrtC family protease
MKLALGPVLYGWSREELSRFYDQVAQQSVDIVYLGEVVCSRRRGFRPEDWLETAARLTAAGKEVVLSTLALLETNADLRAMRKTVANGSWRVEANDMAAVAALSEQRLEFVAGPHLNVYNNATLELLVRHGARRWVPPVELPRASLGQLLQKDRSGAECEVFLLGRMPLALSARCFTARRHGLEKDGCENVCEKYPDGLMLATRDGDPFLALNGIQTQSSSVCNLVGELPALRELGVAAVRVSPHAQGCMEIIGLVRSALDGALAPAEAAKRVERLLPGPACNGYWYGKPGMDNVALAG